MNLRALEAGGHVLAAIVDEHLDGDGQHEADAERLGLDGGAEFKSCGVFMYSSF